MKKILIGLAKALGSILLFCVILGGMCAVLVFDRSPDSIELVKTGKLLEYRIVNTPIPPPPTMTWVTIEGCHELAIDQGELSNLTVGKTYYLYNLYRDGWNSYHLLSSELLDLNNPPYNAYKITEGKRDRFFH